MKKFCKDLNITKKNQTNKKEIIPLTDEENNSRKDQKDC